MKTIQRRAVRRHRATQPLAEKQPFPSQKQQFFMADALPLWHDLMNNK
jgi:hypothetical protein